MSWERRLLEPEVMALAIPIVAILVFGAVRVIKSLIVHRERIAMIEHGIHPDYPPDDEVDNRPGGPTF